MSSTEIATIIAHGCVHYTDHTENLATMEWVPHPAYKGVCLKHIIKGKETNGLFSSHLVKIDPNCRLETHYHEHQLELHEIIQGRGSFHLLDQQHEYQAGKMAIIPMGTRHMVQAGATGLVLMAKFFPALL